MKRTTFYSALVGVLLTLCAYAPSSLAASPDWTSYALLLQKHVSNHQKNGITLNYVDYSQWRHDSLWPQVLATLEKFDTRRLSSKNEKLAFYINAYNILAINTVISHWPLDSIKDAGGFFSSVWSQQAGHLGGQAVTLDQIENKILRPMGEPRIHMAIVCASVSCPDLATTPYAEKTLNQQLDQQAKQFLYNPEKGLKVSKKTLVMSKIFDWFEEDFSVMGGVGAFAQRYRTDLSFSQVSGFFDYDWSLNGS